MDVFIVGMQPTKELSRVQCAIETGNPINFGGMISDQVIEILSKAFR